MKQIVIYHRADFDGIFCREIARKFLPDATLIGWDYGDPTPGKAEIDGADQLYMLDISVADLMDHPNLIWIDHHKSAMEKYDLPLPRSDYEAASMTGHLAARAALPPTNKQLALDRIILGYRIDGVAACRLTWQWFYLHVERGTLMSCMPSKEEYVERELIEPLAVRLAGEYDIWDKRDPDAELFQHGLRSRELTLHDWTILLSSPSTPTISEIESMIDVGHPIDCRPDGTVDTSVSFVRGLLNAGRAIQYAQTQQNESIIKAAGFTIEFEGLKFLACNHARYNSFLFTAGLTPEHDGCFGFAWRDGHWNVSLYHAPGKEHHDLSLIATRFGGGGHRGACGFRVKTLPFLT